MLSALTATQSAASITTSVIPLQLFSGNFLTIAIIFFVLAIVAAIFGARGVAGISMGIAKWFVIIFIILAIVSLVL